MSEIHFGPLSDWIALDYARQWTKHAPTCQLCTDDNPLAMRLQARSMLTNRGKSGIIEFQDQKGTINDRR